jgi:DNA-binding MarR family transcriptional regulator
VARPTTEDYQRVASLRAALRVFARRSERLARAEGITPRQYELLLMIKGAADGSERSRVTELAQALQLTQSTVTELVGRAEDAGLLTREASPDDGRVRWLRLSAEGEAKLAAVLRRLGPERRRLAEIVARLPEAADQAEGRKTPRASSSRRKRVK